MEIIYRVTRVKSQLCVRDGKIVYFTYLRRYVQSIISILVISILAIFRQPRHPRMELLISQTGYTVSSSWRIKNESLRCPGYLKIPNIDIANIDIID